MRDNCAFPSRQSVPGKRQEARDRDDNPDDDDDDGVDDDDDEKEENNSSSADDGEIVEDDVARFQRAKKTSCVHEVAIPKIHQIECTRDGGIENAKIFIREIRQEVSVQFGRVSVNRGGRFRKRRVGDGRRAHIGWKNSRG